MNTDPPPAPIRRRSVYYLSGFDPRGARFYHQLYRSEAERQSAVDGCRYQVGPRQAEGSLATSWPVRCDEGGSEIFSRYVFLRWDDLVRAHWPASAARVLVAMPRFYWRYAARLGTTWRCTPRAFWTLLTPLLYVLLTIGAAAATGAAVPALAARFGSPGAFPLLAWALGAAAAGVVLGAAWRRAERLRLFWLMRIFLFLLDWGRRQPADLDARWAALAEKICDDQAQAPADEVLIVGHSVGSVAAVAVADGCLRLLASRGSAAAPRLKLLTLGQVTPFVGFMPEAGWLRERLARVAASEIVWLDYTAPVDSLCYRLVDPVTACGLPPRPPERMRVRSARFDLMFAPDAYREIRRDAFRVHFQYLMSSRKPAAYNYFRLTAGGEPLETRIHAA